MDHILDHLLFLVCINLTEKQKFFNFYFLSIC